MGLTPIKVKFMDMSPNGMEFILNGSDHCMYPPRQSPTHMNWGNEPLFGAWIFNRWAHPRVPFPLLPPKKLQVLSHDYSFSVQFYIEIDFYWSEICECLNGWNEIYFKWFRSLTYVSPVEVFHSHGTHPMGSYLRLEYLISGWWALAAAPFLLFHKRESQSSLQRPEGCLKKKRGTSSWGYIMIILTVCHEFYLILNIVARACNGVPRVKSRLPDRGSDS